MSLGWVCSIEKTQFLIEQILRESGQYDVKNMIVALGVFTLRGGDEKGQ